MRHFAPLSRRKLAADAAVVLIAFTGAAISSALPAGAVTSGFADVTVTCSDGTANVVWTWDSASLGDRSAGYSFQINGAYTDVRGQMASTNRNGTLYYTATLPVRNRSASASLGIVTTAGVAMDSFVDLTGFDWDGCAHRPDVTRVTTTCLDSTTANVVWTWDSASLGGRSAGYSFQVNGAYTDGRGQMASTNRNGTLYYTATLPVHRGDVSASLSLVTLGDVTMDSYVDLRTFDWNAC